MHFKVYRDSESRRLRKVVIELYNDSGALVDHTRCFGYLAMVGFSLRVRMRQRAMLALHRAMQKLSREV